MDTRMDERAPQPERHWRRTRRLTACLLALWFAIAFGSVFFARELAGLTLFGWPLSFFLVAQGAVFGFLAIVGFYAWRMGAADDEAGQPPGEQGPA